MKKQKLTKRMVSVLNEKNGETTKVVTADKMNELGIIKITDRWVMRAGNPAFSATGGRVGEYVYQFTINESHPLVVEWRGESELHEDDPTRELIINSRYY